MVYDRTRERMAEWEAEIMKGHSSSRVEVALAERWGCTTRAVRDVALKVRAQWADASAGVDKAQRREELRERLFELYAASRTLVGMEPGVSSACARLLKLLIDFDDLSGAPSAVLVAGMPLGMTAADAAESMADALRRMGYQVSGEPRPAG